MARKHPTAARLRCDLSTARKRRASPGARLPLKGGAQASGEFAKRFRNLRAAHHMRLGRSCTYGTALSLT